MPFVDPPALVSRLPSFGSWSSAWGRGEEGERTKIAGAEGNELRCPRFGAGRAGLSGGRGGGRLPVQPRDGQEQRWRGEGVRKRRYCVYVPWGRRSDCRNQINAVELRGAAGRQRRGRGRTWGRSPGGRQESSSLIQKPLWVPSKPSHARVPVVFPPPGCPPIFGVRPCSLTPSSPPWIWNVFL